MIRRIVLSAAVLVSACACLAAPASADAAPMTRAIDSFEYVVDGTDIYYLETKRSKKGNYYKYTDRLVRKSFLDKSKTVIAKLDALRGGFPDEIVAGGGYVYVNLYDDGLDNDPEKGSSSQVLRISRDGSSKQVVAQGQLQADEEWGVVVEGKKAKLNDCGTSVEAEAASATGSVVIRETVSERNSKACGRKKNVDRNRHYELRLDGSTREIVNTEQRVVGKYKVFDGDGYEGTTGFKGSEAWGFSVVGDRVLYSYGVGGKLWVKDFSTGLVAGPYVATPPSPYGFQIGTIDFTGRLAIFGLSFPKNAKKADDLKVVTGLYPTPGDATNFKELSNKAVYLFCGNHLIAAGATKALELDPVTLATIRTIDTGSPYDKLDLSLGCNDKFMYYSESRKKRADLVTAIPLG